MDPNLEEHVAADLAAAHLTAELEWLLAVISAHGRRLQRAGVLPGDDVAFPGASVTAAQFDARSRRAEAEGLDPDAAEEVAAATARRARTVAELASLSNGLPLLEIQRRFGLSEVEYVVLLLSLAPEFSPAFGQMFAFVQNHFDRQAPTLALVADCFPGLGVGLRRLLDPDRPLARWRLVRLDPSRAGQPTLARPVSADPRIVRWIEGDGALDPSLRACATLDEPTPEDDPILPEADEPTWERLLAHAADREGADEDAPPLVVLHGPAGAGKLRWARELARRLELGTLRVDLPSLRAREGGLREGLAVAAREARLHGALLCLSGWEDLVTRDGGDDARPEGVERPADLLRVLADALGDLPGGGALLVASDRAPLPTENRVLFGVSAPDRAAAIHLWERYLPSDLRGPGATPEALTEAFSLTPGQIVAAVREARVEAAGRGEPDASLSLETLASVIRRQVRHRLGDIAVPVSSSQTWDDLIVPEEVRYQLEELVSRYRSRALVYGDWGFGRRFGTSGGLSVLFDGPPGTGKTMAAGLVGRELGLDVYQVDLSRVVSRYVGETEKKLARLFDEAERAHAVLLFDEADSLFARRTNVQSANDRYANLEVNYLLQRVERFSGIAILTTNFAASIDDAFARRLSSRITFSKPERDERERLWRSMLTDARNLADDVDLDDLADGFELSGGHIRNAVLRAAFLAASRDGIIDMHLLEIACRIEQKEQGMLVHGSPYADLVRPAEPTSDW